MLVFPEIHQFEAWSKHLPGIAPIMKERPSVIVKTSLSNHCDLFLCKAFMTEKEAAYVAFVEDDKTIILLSENPLGIIGLSDGKISVELDHAAGSGCPHPCLSYRVPRPFFWAGVGWTADRDSATLLGTGSHGLIELIVRKLFIKLGNSE